MHGVHCGKRTLEKQIQVRRFNEQYRFIFNPCGVKPGNSSFERNSRAVGEFAQPEPLTTRSTIEAALGFRLPSALPLIRGCVRSRAFLLLAFSPSCVPMLSVALLVPRSLKPDASPSVLAPSFEWSLLLLLLLLPLHLLFPILLL